MIYQKMKDKWRSLLEDRRDCQCFDEGIETGEFCMHLCDMGWDGKFDDDAEVTGFFESVHDALSYLRFAEIPRMLRGKVDIIPEEAEYYLDSVLSEFKDDVRSVLSNIDKLIEKKKITPDDLEFVKNEYNRVFENFNPMSQILCWGTVCNVLRDSYFSDAFDDILEEEAEEGDSTFSELKKLVDSNTFKYSNSQHRKMAQEFFDIIRHV